MWQVWKKKRGAVNACRERVCTGSWLGEKKSLPHSIAASHPSYQYCVWLFSWMFYQLNFPCSFVCTFHRVWMHSWLIANAHVHTHTHSPLSLSLSSVCVCERASLCVSLWLVILFSLCSYSLFFALLSLSLSLSIGQATWRRNARAKRPSRCSDRQWWAREAAEK